MMRFLLPYPFLSLGLLIMWLLLSGFTLGHLVLGTIISLLASKTMTALEPSTPPLRNWTKLIPLFFIVVGDIVRSNIAVASLVLHRDQNDRVSGFVTIPLDLKDRTGLALLACILTSTPGTAWVEYHSANGELLLHVLDLVDEATWVDQIKNRYERVLLEVFE